MPLNPDAAPAAPTFTVEQLVRFDDCDPAGIVYYPRYFCMINAVVEDWWAHLGQPWHELIPQRRIVTPVSHLESVFLRPSQMGDRLHFHLSVEAVSRSSLRLHHRVVGPDGLERFRVRQRMVCVSTEGNRPPAAWPADIKAILTQWLPPKDEGGPSPPAQR